VTRQELAAWFLRVRQDSNAMVQPLDRKDYWAKQPMSDVSPPGWNIGHTSWFFRNVLERFGGVITPIDVKYDYFLNSYYSTLGKRLARNQRGAQEWISVPDLLAYRQSVDKRIVELIWNIRPERWSKLKWTITLGLHHERQHQELFWTEIKYFRFMEPKPRPYRRFDLPTREPWDEPLYFNQVPTERIESFGNTEGGWCFDNELSVHERLLQPFALSQRLVTNADFLAFIEDGGYRRESLWQAAGWTTVQSEKWGHPLYWKKIEAQWRVWTLNGTKLLNPLEPVCHVSLWEALAFIEWFKLQHDGQPNLRLPTEFELEHATRWQKSFQRDNNCVEGGNLHPLPYDGTPLSQLVGDVWEWTTSPHSPYPGYKPFEPPFAEYTKKFMYTPFVLRGGSCCSASDHLRPSYRNYWDAGTRFQFSGFRLAESLG
jgi:ergothioneine biosynthesis protein EgtB